MRDAGCVWDGCNTSRCMCALATRRATHSMLFVVGVGVQGLACWNAEFSVEQVIRS